MQTREGLTVSSAHKFYLKTNEAHTTLPQTFSHPVVRAVVKNFQVNVCVVIKRVSACPISCNDTHLFFIRNLFIVLGRPNC